MESHKTTDTKNTMIIAGAIVIAGILIAGAVYLGGHGTAGTTDTTQGTVAVDASKLNTEGEPYIGEKDAPLTIAYWYDYQCPFCKQGEQTVLTPLVTDYVNTGKVKIVFKDFAFLGADSQTLGLASRAVWEVAPTKFYAWHKAVFMNQGQENSGWATSDVILSITSSVLGASDANKVMSLMVSKKAVYQAAMAADKTEGGAVGVNGTPSFVIGTQLLVGAESYSKIQSAIKSQLK